MNSQDRTAPRFLTISSEFALLLFVSISMALVVHGCSENSTGPPGNNGGNEIGTEPTFTNVQMIFQQNCSPCHIGGTTSGVRLDSYTNVLESVGNQYDREVVQPGNADESPLVDKIEPNPTVGNRMPQGGSFLSTGRINQIKEWIDNGAENN